MSTISGTFQGATLLHASPNGAGARKTYLATYSFGAYTGSGDSGAITGMVAALAGQARNGKTLTIASSTQGIGVVCVGAGIDTAGQAVYVGAVTVVSATTGSLTFNLTTADGTEITASTACSGVQLAVTVDES